MTDNTLMMIAGLFGYLLGSIPFGLLLTRLAGMGDIREIGSGNIGATNVLRTGRKDLAALTLLLDSGKGAIAVLVTLYFISPDFAPLAGAAAFLGHCFPLYLKFKGGKGIATFLGTLVAINPLIGLISMGGWLLAALVLRMSSFAGLTAALIATIYAFIDGQTALWPYLAFMTALIFIRHKDNIVRIIKGEEPKIGKKKKS